MPRCHGWQRVAHAQGWAVYRKEPGKAVRICTGCTVCRGAMDGKEWRMYRSTVCRGAKAKSGAYPWKERCRGTDELLSLEI